MKERKKLSLKKVRISNLSPFEMNNIRGGTDPIDEEEDGFLSIGEDCSIENSCKRMTRRNDLRCSECQNSTNGTCA